VSTGDDLQAPLDDPATSAEIAERATAKGDVTVVEPTRAQQTLARRVAESRATIPDFTARVDLDLSDAADARDELRLQHGAAAPSFTHLIVKAAALALRDVPRVNGSYRDNRFELYSRVNVGVAVATPEGLVTPTIFDADAKSVLVIAEETRALAAKARDGSITARETGGATFTVTNLGMHGVAELEAPINPPQAAILAIGAITSQLGPDPTGERSARRIARATLTCDHRIVSGLDAAAFLRRVRELFAEPAALLA
jgi:pyruvate dehydrogenase E2 component (dihydrolipoamide acetyltransferase)